MTYTKTGTEFPDECADAGLSDAAYRTHHEGITWVCRLQCMELTIGRHMLLRFASTARPEEAVAELVEVGYWRTTAKGWVIVHHADVVRQGLAAQLKHNSKQKVYMAEKRAEAKRERSVASNVATNVASSVATNVATRVSANADRLTDRQTDSQQESSSVDWPEVAVSQNGKALPDFKPQCRTCGGALRTAAELNARACSAHLRGGARAAG